MEPYIRTYIRTRLCYWSKCGSLPIIADQFVDYCALNGLRELLQSAYARFHSTETALTRVHNDISMATDGKKVVIWTLLDLMAAFDTVDHTIPLTRLEKRFGVKWTALEWFRSYLMNRKQLVALPGGARSPCCHQQHRQNEMHYKVNLSTLLPKRNATFLGAFLLRLSV